MSTFRYIKELADRINSLESQLQPTATGQADVHYQTLNEEGSPAARGYHEFSPAVDSNLLPRKRTYSMSEGVGTMMGLPVNQGPRQPSVGGWPAISQAKDAQPYALAGLEAYAAQNGAPKVTQPFWSHGQPTADIEPTEEVTPIEIDEKVLDA